MYFSKVFTLISLAIVATAVPNINPNAPEAQLSNDCPNNGATKACCNSKQTFNLNNPSEYYKKLAFVLRRPNSGNGGILNNILPGLLQTVSVPLGLECSLDIGSCNEHTCCVFGPEEDTEENTGAFSDLLKNGLIGDVHFCTLL
ncbi:hypothetical protein N431DRAFT_485386 [Stipitochalara longipes BDJ]|nr:hypothetical protein N431DRAFT_485386 [Stipitochalara longipes BDJ]